MKKIAATALLLILNAQMSLAQGIAPGAGSNLLVYRNLDLGVTGQVVDSAVGQLYGGLITNQSAAFRYVKIYNKATAPTSADTPVVTITLPAGSVVPLATSGLAFSAGISLRGTTGIADNDTGAPATNDIVVNVFYK